LDVIDPLQIREELRLPSLDARVLKTTAAAVEMETKKIVERALKLQKRARRHTMTGKVFLWIDMDCYCNVHFILSCDMFTDAQLMIYINLALNIFHNKQIYGLRRPPTLIAAGENGQGDVAQDSSKIDLSKSIVLSLLDYLIHPFATLPSPLSLYSLLFLSIFPHYYYSYDFYFETPTAVAFIKKPIGAPVPRVPAAHVHLSRNSSLRTRLWCTMILLLTSQGCPGATSSIIASPLSLSTKALLKSSHFTSHFFCLSPCFVFCRMFGGRAMAFFYSRVTSSLLSGQQEAIQTVCSLLREDRCQQELGGYFCRCHMKHELRK
jgi:hypothetical protein